MCFALAIQTVLSVDPIDASRSVLKRLHHLPNFIIYHVVVGFVGFSLPQADRQSLPSELQTTPDKISSRSAFTSAGPANSLPYVQGPKNTPPRNEVTCAVTLQ